MCRRKYIAPLFFSTPNKCRYTVSPRDTEGLIALISNRATRRARAALGSAFSGSKSTVHMWPTIRTVIEGKRSFIWCDNLRSLHALRLDAREVQTIQKVFSRRASLSPCRQDLAGGIQQLNGRTSKLQTAVATTITINRLARNWCIDFALLR
jgi:hypothetical protein